MNYYENFFKKFLFPLYEQALHKRNTTEKIKEYESNLLLTKEEIENIQWTKLKALLQHCIDNVPYYKESWEKLGFYSAEDFKSMEDFKKLPVLTKQIIRDNQKELVAKNHKGKNMKKATGGSTGQPMSLELNLESEIARQAVMWRGYGKIGAGLGVKTLYLWGGEISNKKKLLKIKQHLHHWIFNRKLMNSNLLTNDNMMDYIKGINEYKPNAIVAFTNPLFELSKYILKNNIKIHTPKSIVTGAEPLFEHQRELIEKAFNCKVFNTYGCREVMLIASECENQTGLHINADHLVVETLKNNKDEVFNEVGDVVITDLHNYGMPFIRYVNGDMAIKEEKTCSCGNPMPMLKEVTGRKLDMLKSPKGHLVPGTFFTHFIMGIPGIERFQVIQNTLDTYDFNLIINDEFKKEKEEKEIQETISRFTDNSVNVKFNYPKELTMTSGGKFRLTIFNAGN